MLVDTNFRRSDVPSAMTWLSSQIGGPLKKRVANLEDREGKNPLFGFYCRRHFALEFALEQAQRHRRTTNRFPRGDPYVLSYGFAFGAKRLYENLDVPARKRFAGCLQDGVKGVYGLRPLAYEIQILAHLCRWGFDVECADLSGKAKFDFLATRSGAQLEIECKTTAPDAGRKVHFEELSSLGGYILPTSRRLFATGGYHLIRIQVPDRLQATDTSMKAIASLVEAATSSAGTTTDEFATVEHRRVTTPAVGSLSDIEDQARAMFAAEFGVETGSIMYHGSTSGGGFVAVAVQSAKADNVIDKLSDRAKDASRQCTGTRPAVIAMQLVDMSRQALWDAVNKPSGLYDIASSVFADGTRGHVNSIVFTIPPVLERDVLVGVAEATGPVGIIPNPKPTYPSAMVSTLFTPSDQSIIAAAHMEAMPPWTPS